MPGDLTPADVRRILGRDAVTIVEAGANDGEETAGFLAQFPDPDTRVICFEPWQPAIERWRARISDQRAVLLPVALADTDSVRPFHPSGGTAPGARWIGYGEWDKSGSLLEPDRHQEFDTWLRFPPGPLVPCYRLDTLAVDWFEIGMLWADLQGGEALMLAGAQRTLQRVQWVYLECSVRPLYHGQARLEELDALLPGFERVGQFGENFLWRRGDA